MFFFFIFKAFSFKECLIQISVNKTIKLFCCLFICESEIWSEYRQIDYIKALFVLFRIFIKTKKGHFPTKVDEALNTEHFTDKFVSHHPQYN